ncbi:MAG TPA: hypothetical protein VLV54_18790 [Thermoanaerobaculia bacterium]|nr:hypothetical protein [Thermoanaerobaculia bacterium]
MVRKMLATAFVLALSCLAQVSITRQAAALSRSQASTSILLSADPVAAAACTKHVCDICVASGLACTPIPYCHCF